MGILGNLLKGKSSKQEMFIEEARSHYINDLSEKIDFLKGCNSEYVETTKKTFRLFQQVFQTRFTSPLEYRDKSSEVRENFCISLSNALSTLENKKKESEALGLSIFLILLSAIELGDATLLSQIENILVRDLLSER